jgi:prevent-host-death family protein
MRVLTVARSFNRCYLQTCIPHLKRRKSMPTKFSEDVIPLSDVKVNPGRVVRQVTETRRPVLLTSRGRGVAVLQSMADYEAEAEERRFMKAVVQGIMELEEGRGVSRGEEALLPGGLRWPPPAGLSSPLPR